MQTIFREKKARCCYNGCVGSPFEFDHNNYKHKDFVLLSEKSHFTDDTVMTVAVARGLMAGQGDAPKPFAEVQHEMQYWGRAYPNAGYGGRLAVRHTKQNAGDGKGDCRGHPQPPGGHQGRTGHGGSDTLACITGGIAEAFYGMPQELQRQALVKTPGAIHPGCQCRHRRSFRTGAQRFLRYAKAYSCRRLRSDLHGQHPRQPRRYPY